MQQYINFKINIIEGDIKEIAESINPIVRNYNFEKIDSEEKLNLRMRSWLEDIWYCLDTIGNDSETNMYIFDYYTLFPSLFHDINNNFKNIKFKGIANYYNDDVGIIETCTYEN